MSQRHSEYEPIPGDLYCTPAWVTEVLLGVETFSTGIWEPACGHDDMANVIREKTGGCLGTDIASGVDFLKAELLYPGQSIITNPPYSKGLAEKFVRHALDLTEPVAGKVAMLLPHAWDTAKSRHDILGDHVFFKAKYALTRRIRWANLEQKKNGPSQNHAWFVWDWGFSGTPTIGYLP